MLKKVFLNSVIYSFSALFLASCGSPGDSGDGTIALAASPDNITLSSSTCGYASGPLITVYGGVAPYFLKNPLPKSIGLSREKINKSGENFKVEFLGGCFTTLPILILDSNGNNIEFEVTYTNTAQR